MLPDLIPGLWPVSGVVASLLLKTPVLRTFINHLGVRVAGTMSIHQMFADGFQVQYIFCRWHNKSGPTEGLLLDKAIDLTYMCSYQCIPSEVLARGIRCKDVQQCINVPSELPTPGIYMRSRCTAVAPEKTVFFWGASLETVTTQKATR